MLDREGVIYKGRPKVDQFKSAHAVNTKLRTLEEAMKGADIFLGLSAKNVVTPAMVKSMAKDPIIFACANPDPEILPELIEQTRSDAIIATGRSDYPNQVNNVLGFPYIFRGALDCRAKTINEEMKIAAAKAIADLAKEDVPDEVVAAYGGARTSRSDSFRTRNYWNRNIWAVNRNEHNASPHIDLLAKSWWFTSDFAICSTSSTR